MGISHEQWDRLAPLLPEAPRGPRRQGGPGKDLPERSPPCRACRGWFQRRRKEGGVKAAPLALGNNLGERGKRT